MSMVTYDYTDLATGEEADDPLAGSYSVMELHREHLVRYVMTTSQGAIILRHLPLRMKRIIDSVRHLIYPGLASMEQEAVNLLPYFEGIPEEDVEPEAKGRLLELKSQIALTDMYALGVIVAPALANMDEYEALYESLTDSEQMTLATAVQTLSAVRPPSQVDSVPLDIADKLGIQLMDDGMLQMMTVSQAAFYIDRIRRENQAMERMLGQDRRRVG